MAIRLTKTSSQYLRQSAFSGAIDYRSAYTITFSLYIAAFPGDRQTVLLLESINGGSQAQALHVENTGVVALECTGQTQSGTTISSGQWYDIAIVRESATSAKVYIDGSLSGSANTQNVSGWAVTRNLYVGTWFAASWYGNFRIANLKAFQAALTVGEIALEHAYYAPSYGTPAAYYRMDDATLADAIKDEGGTYDFTTGGTPTIEADPSIGESPPVDESIGDTAAGTDSTSGALSLSQALADSASGSDSVAPSTVSPAALTDSGAATDAMSSGIVAAESITDAAAATAAMTSAVIAAHALTEAAAASDFAFPARALSLALADVATVADALAGTGQWSESMTDAAAASDALAIAVLIEISDAADATDEAKGYGGSFAAPGVPGQTGGGRPVAASVGARHNDGGQDRRSNLQSAKRGH